MAQISESFHYVRSGNTDFRNALSPQASQYADLPIVSAQAAGPNRVWITSLKILSIENLDWRVEFHGRSLSAGSGVTYSASGYLGTNSLQGYVGFTNNAATAYATTFLYYTHGLKIPYEDQDGTGQLHINLLNQSAPNQAAGRATKFAGDEGAVFIHVGIIDAS